MDEFNKWLAGGGLVLLGGGVKWAWGQARPLLEARRAAISKRGVRAINECWRTAARLLNQTSAHRAMVLYTQNGGGRPSATNPIKSSIAYEAQDEHLRPMYDEWQDRRIDGAYVDILQRMLEDGHTLVRVSELPEGSLLQNLYQNEGIARSEVHHLRSTDTQVWYLVLNYTEDSEADLSRDRPTILAGRDRLCKLLEQAG